MARTQLKTISQALEVLDEAAKEESEELKEMISKDYEQLKSTISTMKPKVKQGLQVAADVSKEKLLEAKEDATRFVKETSQKVDKSAHENPWYFVGGASLIGAALGFMVSQKLKD